MTIYEVIDNLEKIARTQPLIGSTGEGDIYEYMNADPSVKYATFFITQGQHTETEMFDNYNLTLFYIDRLTDNEDNRVEIQSTGKETLSNIIRTFKDVFDAESENINYQPFTQRFNDSCAGVFASLSIEVEKNSVCGEEYQYAIEAIKIKNQDKEITINENGKTTIVPDPGYTGMDKVTVNVNVPFELHLDQIGLGEEDSFPVNVKRQQYFEEDMAYSKKVYDGWDPETTDATNYFANSPLVYCPKLKMDKTTKIAGMFYSCYDLTYVPPIYVQYPDDVSSMFANCHSLTALPWIYMDKVTNMKFFATGTALVKSVPPYDYSNVENLIGAFQFSSISSIPYMNCKKATKAANLFNYCISLTELSGFEGENIIDGDGMFAECHSLSRLPEINFRSAKYLRNAFKECWSLRHLGGFPELKVSIDLSSSNRLTKESMMNIINKAAKADPDYDNGAPVLTLSQLCMEQLTPEDIKIMTDKGWQVVM